MRLGSTFFPVQPSHHSGVADAVNQQIIKAPEVKVVNDLLEQ